MTSFSTQKKLSPLSAAISNGFAGSIAASIAMIILYPAEIIRIRMQAQDFSKSSESKIRTKKYENFFDCLMKIIKKDGFIGLYMNLNNNVLGTSLANLVYYFWYNLFKYHIYGKRFISPTQNLFVSSLGGIINVLILNPYWVANTQIMLQKEGLKSYESKYSGILDAIEKIYIKKGFINGIYTGLGPALMLISNPAIQFMVYESSLQNCKLFLNRLELTSLEIFMLGAFSKFCATILTYPLQLIKTQFQKRNCYYKNFRHAICDLTENYTKLGNLYEGMDAKLVQTVFNSALMFVFYEKLLVLISKFMRKCVS